MLSLVKMVVEMGIVRKILISYAYVGLWIFLSSTVILFNKFILDKKLYNWPFPISLAMIHMAFCSVLAFALVGVFDIVKPVGMTKKIYVSSVIPISALYCLSLWLSNSAYIYLSVSFIQMLKALMPVAVYSIGVLLKKESFSPKTMTNMVGISVGVAIAAYGEAQFNALGVMLQLGAVVFEATRLVLIQVLLTANGITLNPITTLYYVAPCCFVFLCIPWSIVEYPVLVASSSFYLDIKLFSANCLCAFLLNLAVFLLVSKTSALTMNVAGVVKDWILIAISWSVIKDRVTGVNLMGYCLAFLGVCFYNHLKLQLLNAKQSEETVLDGEKEAKSLLEESPYAQSESDHDARYSGRIV